MVFKKSGGDHDGDGPWNVIVGEEGNSDSTKILDIPGFSCYN